MVQMRDLAFDFTIDKGVRERANAILAAKGMTMSGALKSMMRIGMREGRLPFGISREPSLAGVGMDEASARRLGIQKDGTDGSTGITCGMTLQVTPEEKRQIKKWCGSLCISPHALVRAYTAQISYEMRIPLNS